MDTNISSATSPLRKKLTAASFFGVIAKPQSYLNLLYLLLGFPLGLFYFVFLVTGVAVGFGTLIIWIGLLVLAGVLGISYTLTLFERFLANTMLHTNIPPAIRPAIQSDDLWGSFTRFIKAPATWKGILYLLIRFPLGILYFTLIVTLFSISLGLFSSLWLYSIPWITIDLGWEIIDTANEALSAAIVGVLLFFVSLHVINWTAWLSGELAQIMLRPGPTPAQPTRTAEPDTAPVETEAEAMVELPPEEPTAPPE